MKPLASLLPALLIATLSACASTSGNAAPAADQAAPAADQIERDAREAHAGYYAMLIDQGTADALEHYYHDAYTYVGGDGVIVTKADMAGDDEGPAVVVVSIDDDLQQVSVHGHVAVICGYSTSKLTIGDVEVVSSDGYTEVWVLQDGRWWLAAEHITPRK